MRAIKQQLLSLAQKLLETNEKEKLDKEVYDDLLVELDFHDKQTDSRWKTAYFYLRIVWASITIALLGLCLWFTYWLVSGVGEGHLNFTKYTTFLDIVASNIVITVLGLVAIVMNFLFPKNDTPKDVIKADTTEESVLSPAMNQVVNVTPEDVIDT